jgi:hypothetical protein
MQKHPAGNLDTDSSDHEDHHRSASNADSMIAATTDSGSDSGSVSITSGSSTTTAGDSTSKNQASSKEAQKVVGSSQTAQSKPVVSSSDSKVKVSLVEAIEVAEEPPHSTVFFFLRGAMAAAGAVFVAMQLSRLRGRAIAPGSVPVRRGHHHQDIATNL